MPEPVTLVSVGGATRTLPSASTAGFEEQWFVMDTPAAVPGDSGEIMVEGSPTILIAGGPPRIVWVEVEGLHWELR